MRYSEVVVRDRPHYRTRDGSILSWHRSSSQWWLKPRQDAGATSFATPEAQELTSKIGHRLRQARHAQRLSLGALSDLTGGALIKSRVSNYEEGIRRLGIEEAEVLAAAFGTVSPTYLLCLNDEGFVSEEERTLLR